MTHHNRHILNVVTRMIPADLETSVGIYLKIRDLYPQSALLESSDYHTSQNSVSLIGVDPIGGFTLVNGTIELSYPDTPTETIAVGKGIDIMECLRKYIESYTLEGDNEKGVNGLLGYTAYDAVRYFEKVDIRSFLSHNHRLYFQAGAGIVAYSVPENELQETNNKLGAHLHNLSDVYHGIQSDITATVPDYLFEGLPGHKNITLLKQFINELKH